MTTARWMLIAPTWVALFELQRLQPLSADEVEAKLAAPTASHCGDPFPHVLRARGGELFLQDGHHRVAAAARLGCPHVIARVLNV